MSNTTVKLNTCSSDNKCEKLWIVVYNQSATVTYITVRHYKHQDVPNSTTATTRLNTGLYPTWL